MWDERYGEHDYAYGKKPNAFLAQILTGISPKDGPDTGTILFPCEGEGRNAVHAAKSGWVVSAFDGSIEGKKKADLLAKSEQQEIDYLVADAITIEYPPESFDIIALVFAHFPPTIRENFHLKALQWLRPGGYVILEAFNVNQVKYTSGGPKQVDMLYHKEMLEEDFDELDFIYLKELNVELDEGKFHQGEAAVIRMVARKP